jgi:hypothetical protein
MSASHDAPELAVELEQALTDADPAVLLLPPRLVCRIIKQHRQLSGLGLQVPHRRCYVIERTALLRIAGPQELGLLPGRELPSPVMLIAHPNMGRPVQLSAAEALAHCWRMVFHCRIHAALEQQLEDGKLSAADIQRHIERIGATEFEEIRRVLQQERHLLPPGDDAGVVIEFVAAYLGLRLFAPRLIPAYFPALRERGRVDDLVAELVDAAALFAGIPAGCGLEGGGAGEVPAAEAEGLAEAIEAAPQQAAEKPQALPSAMRAARLLAKAEQVAATGNTVRAAILRAQTGPWRQAGQTETARAELCHLARRLQAVLALSDRETEAWGAALPDLLGRASRGFWTVEARLLYDLQKVCVDHERGLYTADLVGWALSLGRRPIHRPLPGQQRVRLVRHLRSAARRLLRARLPDDARRQLTELLGTAIRHTEERLRVHFRPLLRDALDEVGLAPANLPERVARHKLIEEMLDRIVERGFLTLGDLRDTLSRNQLKLPDLSGGAECLRGDPLIRLNRQLAVTLDGVYHGGEIYLRWLQRLSSLAFGTRPGRFLTRYIALPFGGAYLLLNGLGHFTHGLHLHLGRPQNVLALGFFFLGLLHVPPFRRQVVSALRLTGRGLHALVVSGPLWLAERPLVHAVLQSRPVVFFGRHLLSPLIIAGLGWLAAYLGGLGPIDAAGIGVLVFAGAVLLCNSRLGRDLGETLMDETVRMWRRLSADLVPALFHFVMDFFKQILDQVERLLYAVDEWLRFKEGDNRVSQVVKPVLGLVWFLITYVVRFALTLLVEPQVNPVKHFPVVTVAHKLLLPFIPTLAGALELTMEVGAAYTVATVIIASMPGIFGFLVWELKENWRLYAANRPTVLQPVAIGHHGETMQRLLRPGFHSGTIPRLYAKLRRAERRGKRKAVRKLLEALHEAAGSIRHFIEREFLDLLRHDPCGAGGRLSVDAIRLSTGSVQVELGHGGAADWRLTIELAERSGWLVARVARMEGVNELAGCERQVLRTALAGLYKLAGVALIEEQIEAVLRPARVSFCVGGASIVVRPEGRHDAEAVYDLQEAGGALEARVTNGVFPRTLPVLQRREVIFDDQQIPWEEWVAAWEGERKGVVQGVRVLGGEEGTRPS